MAKAPAFQFYAGDFLVDTQDWPCAATGAHVRLLAWSWVNRRGIPRDSERMNRIAEDASKHWAVIGEKWKEGPDGTWVNERLEETRADSDKFRARQAEKSKLGVQARTGKSPKRRRSGKPTDEPEQQPTGQPVGNPLEGEGEVEDSTQVSGKERARKGPDPDVQGVIDYLTDRLKAEGIAKSLDGPAENNRWAARSLIQKLGKEEPDFPALDSAKALIDAAMSDGFHRTKATTVRYLLNNCAKIGASFKSNGTGQARTPTPDQAARKTAEYFARKRGSKPPEPTGNTEPKGADTADVKT